MIAKMKWMIRSFEPFKSSGPDGIIPALLQEAVDLLVNILKAFSHPERVPEKCKISKALFILKAEIIQHKPSSEREIQTVSLSQAKSYLRPYQK